MILAHMRYWHIGSESCEGTECVWFVVGFFGVRDVRGALMTERERERNLYFFHALNLARGL